MAMNYKEVIGVSGSSRRLSSITGGVTPSVTCTPAQLDYRDGRTSARILGGTPQHTEDSDTTDRDTTGRNSGTPGRNSDTTGQSGDTPGSNSDTPGNITARRRCVKCVYSHRYSFSCSWSSLLSSGSRSGSLGRRASLLALGRIASVLSYGSYGTFDTPGKQVVVCGTCAMWEDLHTTTIDARD